MGFIINYKCNDSLSIISSISQPKQSQSFNIVSTEALLIFSGDCS